MATWPIPLLGLLVMGSWFGGMSPAKHFAKLKHFLVRFLPFREGTFLIKGEGEGWAVIF